MITDLVNVTTADGLRLDGALYATSASAAVTDGVDAVLLLHGTGSNFYSTPLLTHLANVFVERGAAALRVNTRGHDGISTTDAPLGLRLQGAAYELIDACCHDIEAWVDLLNSHGYARVGLIGHSLGAVKAIYSQAVRPHAAVRWVVAISPPRLSHAAYAADTRAEEFLRDYALAAQLVRDGRARELIEIRYPIAYAISAAGFVDKYGPEERYNVLRLIERVECPLVVTYGADELNSNAAFRGMPADVDAAAAGGPRRVYVVDGADHIYTGTYAELVTRIERGLRHTAVR